MNNAIHKADPYAQPIVIVVVPSFNEAQNIGQVITELLSLEIAGCQLDFVVVDDGSTDHSIATAVGAGAKVLPLPMNMGIGICFQTGLIYALQQGADFVIQLDGDGQHIPSEISKLAKVALQNQADVVIGSRFLESSQRGISSTTFSRYVGSRVLAICLKLTTGIWISDPTSGFRMMNRKAASYVARRYPDDYPEVQILGAFARKGFRIKEVPVEMKARVHGESSITLILSFYYIIKVTLAVLIERLRR